MVVFNHEEGNCQIYEIKHSKEMVLQQCRHLLDKKRVKKQNFVMEQ